MSDIICEWCLESFTSDTSETAVCCPYCRNMTRIDVDEEVEITHNWSKEYEENNTIPLWN